MYPTRRTARRRVVGLRLCRRDPGWDVSLRSRGWNGAAARLRALGLLPPILGRRGGTRSRRRRGRKRGGHGVWRCSRGLWGGKVEGGEGRRRELGELRVPWGFSRSTCGFDSGVLRCRGEPRELKDMDITWLTMLTRHNGGKV